jgi:2-polyprenyl-3-methyl-5-hydroxy-6-metoxy-1,4-benzoquinol methylase
MDLDTFYSENPASSWETVLGEGMHYHYRGAKVLEETLEFIPGGARILDCGCGWGGSGRFFQKRGHDVTGVTISKQQAEYIRDFPVVHADLHDYVPEESFDVGLMVECCFHLRDRRKVFDNLVPWVKDLVIVDVVCPTVTDIPEFGLKVGPREYLFGDLWKVGYVVQKYVERIDFYQDTQKEWRENINKLPEEEVFGHIRKLKYVCESNDFSRFESEPKQIILHAKRR